MAYPIEVTVGAMVPESSFFYTAQSLTQAAATYGVWTAHYPVILQRISFKVSTNVLFLTNSVVAANLITGLSNATPVTTQIGTMTIPIGSTAGTVYYNNVTPTLIPVGCQLQFALKTQGGLGATPSGAGFLGWYGVAQPEIFTNETVTLVKALTS